MAENMKGSMGKSELNQQRDAAVLRDKAKFAFMGTCAVCGRSMKKLALNKNEYCSQACFQKRHFVSYMRGMNKHQRSNFMNSERFTKTVRHGGELPFHPNDPTGELRKAGVFT